MKRSKFNLSNYQMLTHDMGQLVPCGLVEVLPGDTFQHAASVLVRAMPMTTPPMHNVRYRMHHWYFPSRILMDEFEDFITGGPENNDDTEFPTILLTDVQVGSLADYLGVPVGFTGYVNALPFRAYAYLWNENYRDQDLQAKLAVSLASGVDSTTSTALQNACWEPDYFTKARPWEQKGPAITLPLGTTAEIGGIEGGVFRQAEIGPSANGIRRVDDANFAVNTALVADLRNASSVDVTDVRLAMALQRMGEARARFGSRYTEYLAYLGVRSSDARLQRPEYLGGGKQSLQFSEVLQTAQTEDAGDGVGSLYGHGIAGMRTNRYRRFFEEHGYVMSVAYCLPETIYPQGLNRLWNRRVKDDFWQPELQHIGDQAILMKELYALGADPESTFGYNRRYEEYRRCVSQVHGEFRTILDDWHFARLLSAQPTLNASFVSANPAKRPFQSQSTNVLLAAVNHSLVARRKVASSGSSFIY